jgi:hypothetical protein
MKKRTTITEALAHLRQLIGLGAEFPDAVYSTSVAFELRPNELDLLEELYDQEDHCLA